VLFYRASLPLSRPTLEYLTGVIRRHRSRIGSKNRMLKPGMQALMTLAYLRQGVTFAELGAGFGVSTTTAWRYINETVMLLSARSPKLDRALAKARADGLAHLVLDGTLIAIDRVKADGPFYSGKHRRHGMNLQVIAGPDGRIVWVSGPLPGSAHDLSAARIWGIIRALATTGLIVLADKAYQGAGPHVWTPYKGKNKPEPKKQANRSHARLRGPGERANAWRTGCCTRRNSWWRRGSVATRSCTARGETACGPRCTTPCTTRNEPDGRRRTRNMS
jgi:hypothetical protein